MRERSIVSLSGGMDSSTVLSVAVQETNVMLAVGFRYGSKHNKYELAAAEQVAAHYNVPFRLIDLTRVAMHLESNLLKTGGEIPEGHYEHESMSQTVVPGRNLIFASVLTGVAWTNKALSIWLGIHSGDHAIYPDCRPEFAEALNQTVQAATDGNVAVRYPFLHDDKHSILERGYELGTPYHLTRTCYKDQPIACGKCGSCQERLEAFEKLGKPDPVEYESRTILGK